MHVKMLLAVCAAGLANVAWADYEAVRELSLDSRGIDTLDMDTGAGSLQVVGVAGTDEIVVVATIRVPGRDDDKALRKIESDMVLSLARDGDKAILKSWFDKRMFNFGDSPHIALEVRVPERLHLVVDDGSGSIDIEAVRGDIDIDDGSGSLTLTDAGGVVEIDDGSGSISVRNVGGNLKIEDGSGSIKVRGVAGSVTIDDGSGGIDVSDIEGDLIIVDDGSGGLNFSNIGGRVEKDT